MRNQPISSFPPPSLPFTLRALNVPVITTSPPPKPTPTRAPPQTPTTAPNQAQETGITDADEDVTRSLIDWRDIWRNATLQNSPPLTSPRSKTPNEPSVEPPEKEDDEEDEEGDDQCDLATFQPPTDPLPSQTEADQQTEEALALQSLFSFLSRIPTLDLPSPPVNTFPELTEEEKYQLLEAQGWVLVREEDVEEPLERKDGKGKQRNPPRPRSKPTRALHATSPSNSPTEAPNRIAKESSEAHIQAPDPLAESWIVIERKDAEEEGELVEGEEVEDDWDMCEDADRFRVKERGKGGETTWNGRMRGFFEGHKRVREGGEGGGK